MKLPAYPRTKPSGVEWLGDVPEHWEVKRGRFAMRVNPPAPRLRALKTEDEVSFVPMDAVGVGGGLNLDQTRILAEVSSGYTEFQDGDVVVAKITPCFENGKAALARGLLNGAAYGTTELHVLRAGPTLDRSFVFYIAISDTFRKLGESEMYGAGGQKRVPPEFSKDFRTSVPPLPEQRAIAAFLDRETGRVDRLVAKKRELIERLKEKRSALISRTVTRGLPPAAARAAGLSENPPLKPSSLDWLGDIPKHWEARRAKHICAGIIDCKNRTPDYFDDGEFYVVRTTDVKEGRLDLTAALKTDLENFKEWTQRGAPQKDDVLFTREAPAGEAALFDGKSKVCMGQRMMYFRANRRELNPHFLLFYIYSDAAKTYINGEAGGSTVTHLRLGQVYNFPFIQPPVEEQAAIAAYLDLETAKLDALVGKVEEAVERLQEYRTALITAAVTGKIDVRAVER